MSDFVVVSERDKREQWFMMDFTDDEEIAAVVVIPLFGPDHRAGSDCYCCPTVGGGIIVHNSIQ